MYVCCEYSYCLKIDLQYIVRLWHNVRGFGAAVRQFIIYNYGYKYVCGDFVTFVRILGKLREQ